MAYSRNYNNSKIPRVMEIDRKTLVQNAHYLSILLLFATERGSRLKYVDMSICKIKNKLLCNTVSHLFLCSECVVSKMFFIPYKNLAIKHTLHIFHECVIPRAELLATQLC